MYLPEIFKKFVKEHEELSEAFKKVGDLCAQSGPIDAKTQHLVQLGVSVGVGSQGGVRSHARRAMDLGATEAEVVQVVLLSGTIVGFPAMIAAYGWLQEMLAVRG